MQARFLDYSLTGAYYFCLLDRVKRCVLRAAWLSSLMPVSGGFRTAPPHTHIHRQTKLVTKWISLTVLFAAASQSRSRGMMKQKHTTGLIDAFEINTSEIKDIKMLRDFCGDETDPPSDHQILLLPAKPNITKTVLISGVWKMHFYTFIVYDSMRSYYFSGKVYKSDTSYNSTSVCNVSLIIPWYKWGKSVSSYHDSQWKRQNLCPQKTNSSQFVV